MSFNKWILDSEKKSFEKAAETAKEKNTELVFWEDGEIVKRHPTQKDLIGSDVKKIDIEEIE